MNLSSGRIIVAFWLISACPHFASLSFHRWLFKTRPMPPLKSPTQTTPTLSIPPGRKHQHQEQSITVSAAAAVEKLLAFTN
jgi:hypothetical protein